MSKKHDVHVSTTPTGRYKVTQNGDTLSMHRTQRLADEAARREALHDGVDRVTHGHPVAFAARIRTVR